MLFAGAITIIKKFQSTPACERATLERSAAPVMTWFQSTPACERATRAETIPAAAFFVSIHARVRAGDWRGRQTRCWHRGFNPRPRASGRLDLFTPVHEREQFQSTPACERATCAVSPGPILHMFQSTPACERATTDAVPDGLHGAFQSTPACERATAQFVQTVPSDAFQSTPACERATCDCFCIAIWS